MSTHEHIHTYTSHHITSHHTHHITHQQGLEATPEFFPTNHGPFTPQYPVGANTCFGEQTLIYARALAQAGKVVPQGIADAYEAYYSSPANTSRPYKSYVDQATRKFLANVWAGAKWPNTGVRDSHLSTHLTLTQTPPVAVLPSMLSHTPLGHVCL